MEYFFSYPCFCEESNIALHLSCRPNATMQIQLSTLCTTCEEACTLFSRDVSLIEDELFFEKLSYEVRSYFLLHYQDHWMNLFKFPLTPLQINDLFCSFDRPTAVLMMSRPLNELELFTWVQHYPCLSSLKNVLSILNIKDTYLQLRLDTAQTYFRIKGDVIPFYL